MLSAVVRARSSKELAQPTQYRYSGAVSPGSRMRTPRPSAQSARSDWALPQGLEARSTSRSIGSASDGKLDSTMTRWRRRSTMWSTCSMDTGQAWTQAPQVTQSHTDSSGTAVGTREVRSIGAAGPAVPPSLPARAWTIAPPSANTWSRSPMISSLGESTLPVAKAGQTSWQRPHSVHEYVSSICFQVRSAAVPAPKRISSSGMSGSSNRSGSSLPPGPVRPYQTLNAAEAMCRCLERGR